MVIFCEVIIFTIRASALWSWTANEEIRLLCSIRMRVVSHEGYLLQFSFKSKALSLNLNRLR